MTRLWLVLAALVVAVLWVFFVEPPTIGWYVQERAWREAKRRDGR